MIVGRADRSSPRRVPSAPSGGVIVADAYPRTRDGLVGGFTLIELLVVIAVLGLVAALGVLAFGGVKGGAREAVDLTELKQVETAVDAYIAGEETMPADVDALQDRNYMRVGSLACSYTIAGSLDEPTVTPAC